IGQSDAGRAQVLELVVPADRGEPDPVVDLAHLVQRGGYVLRDEEHATLVAEHHHVAAPGDVLTGVLRAVAHDLLGRGVELHGHCGWVSFGFTGGRLRAGGRQPPGFSMRAATTDSDTPATSSSGRRREPSAVALITTG